MADLESDVPEQIENLLGHRFDVRRNSIAMKEHHVHVAERVQLAATISAQSHQSQRGLGRVNACCGSAEDIPYNHIDQFGSPGADLAPAATGLMLQSKPMFLQLKKALVSRQNFGRALFPADRKLVLGMGQYFLQVSRG